MRNTQQKPDFKVGDRLRLMEKYQQIPAGFEFVLERPPYLMGPDWFVTIPIRKTDAYAIRFEKVGKMIKKGDKVRYLGGDSSAEMWFDKGNVLTVEAVHDDYLHIRSLKDSRDVKKGIIGAFRTANFELVVNPTLTLSGEVVGDELVLPGDVRLKLPKELIPESEEFKEMKAN